MPLRVVVLGKILIVRQPICQSLSALDFQVIESSSYEEVIATIDVNAPSLVVMDADGMSREWRMLAAGLGARVRPAALVLVTSRFSFDDAHDALAHHVAGVIVKPFRKEEHTPRLLDLALRMVNVRARRAAPRFAVPVTRGVLRLPLPDGEEEFPVRNIAEGGAAVAADAERVVSPPAPGGPTTMATLTWGDVEVEAELDVVHRDGDTAGLRFSRIFDGGPRLLRALGESHARALGSAGRRRRW